MFYKDTLSFMISDIDWIFSSFFITINLRINIENLLFIEVRMYTILRFILSDVSIFPIVGYKKERRDLSIEFFLKAFCLIFFFF